MEICETALAARPWSSPTGDGVRICSFISLIHSFCWHILSIYCVVALWSVLGVRQGTKQTSALFLGNLCFVYVVVGIGKIWQWGSDLSLNISKSSFRSLETTRVNVGSTTCGIILYVNNIVCYSIYSSMVIVEVCHPSKRKILNPF